MSQCQEVIAIMHQYAIAGKGKTIPSYAQLEHYKNKVNDKSIKVGGKQLITTLDRYVHPINVINGLPYWVSLCHSSHDQASVIVSCCDPFNVHVDRVIPFLGIKDLLMIRVTKWNLQTSWHQNR